MPRRLFDPYAVLGLPPTATPDEIRRAYRRQLRAHHPDTRATPQSLPPADEHLRQVLAAYAMLRDPERRERYDRATTRYDGAAQRSSTTPRAPAETTTANSAVTVRILGVTLGFGGLTIRRLSD